MSKRSKNYRAALEKFQGKTRFTLKEGIRLLKETSAVKFDATCELHLNLNGDPKKEDQSLRSTLLLPHGTGKTYKIAAVVSDDKVKAAKAAGATAAGLEDLITQFESGKFDYDVILAAPETMKYLGKVAKTLGQKGMMPNPKSGTVTNDIVKTIEELKRGRIEYRSDKEGNLHTVFGKVSFKEEELENNLKAILKSIRDNKPAGIKGTFIKSMTITSTMGPGIHLEVNEALSNL